MSETDGAIHADGTADGPEHEGTSLGLDQPTGPPPALHGPADDPTGSGGSIGVTDGGADGSLDLTVDAGFDGAVDSPVVEDTEVSGDEGDSPGYDRDWQDDGANDPRTGNPDSTE